MPYPVTEAPPGQQPDTWLENFSMRVYGPMLRLASRNDRHFLNAAGNAAGARRYRRTQRLLLREYMRGLTRDFRRLRGIAASRERAGTDASGRSLSLLEQEMSFVFQLWSAEVRIAVNSVLRRPVDLSPLLESIESFAAQTREMTRAAVRLRAT